MNASFYDIFIKGISKYKEEHHYQYHQQHCPKMYILKNELEIIAPFHAINGVFIKAIEEEYGK